MRGLIGLVVVFVAIASCDEGARPRALCPEVGGSQVAVDGSCAVANDGGTKRDASRDYSTECPPVVSMAEGDRACTLAPGVQCSTVCRQCDGNMWIIDRGSQSPCTCNDSGTWDCTHIPVDCFAATLGCPATGSFSNPQCTIPSVCPPAEEASASVNIRAGRPQDVMDVQNLKDGDR